MALLDGRFFASFSPPYYFNFCLFFLPSDPSSHMEEHLVLLLPKYSPLLPVAVTL
jgi:hypothetical protein